MQGEIQELDNINGEAIRRLWDCFVTEAASFAVSEVDLYHMLDISVRQGITLRLDVSFEKACKDLFQLFASDGAEYIDFMEVLMALLFCGTHRYDR